MKKVLVLALLAVGLIATSAMAKEGVYLGGYIPFNDISGKSTDTFSNDYIDSLDTGEGLGIRLGVGLNRYVALEGDVFRSVHRSNYVDVSGDQLVDQDLGGLTASIKVNFPLSNSQVEPYIVFGVGSYELGDSSGNFEGTGTHFGFGADVYLAPELSMNFGLTKRNITFDDNDFGIGPNLESMSPPLISVLHTTFCNAQSATAILSAGGSHVYEPAFFVARILWTCEPIQYMSLHSSQRKKVEYFS